MIGHQGSAGISGRCHVIYCHVSFTEVSDNILNYRRPEIQVITHQRSLRSHQFAVIPPCLLFLQQQLGPLTSWGHGGTWRSRSRVSTVLFSDVGFRAMHCLYMFTQRARICVPLSAAGDLTYIRFL